LAAGPVEIATFDQKPIIVRIPDGTLMALFMRTADGVQSPTARQSSDNGDTWSDESPLFKLPTEPGTWAGFEALVDRDGELHLILLNDARTAGKPFRQRRYDIWHARSEAGRTKWRAPVRAWTGYTGALNSVIQLRSGRILVPFSYLTPRVWRDRGKGLDAFTFRGKFDSTLVYLDEGTDTWKLSPSSLKVTTPDIVSSYGAVEPVVLELKDGRVWMLIRTQLGRFYESFSTNGAEWSAPRPTRLLSSDSPAGIVRLTDGRIVLIWNNCLRFPYAHGGRHVLHAAISEDEGKTWRGYREVAWDPLRSEPPPPRGDHGTAYPFPTAVNDDQVIFATGQGEGRILCMRLDPAWLYETRRKDDFSAGLRDWSVFGTEGVEAIPHPDKQGASVLRVQRTDREWPASAVWNFPAGRSGHLRLRYRLNPGAAGALVGITDHFSVPFDEEAEIHNLFNVHIGADGKVKNGRIAEADAWHTLEMQWDGRKRTCRVTVDGQDACVIPQSRESAGACYLRLSSTAEAEGDGGFLVESAKVDVSASYTQGENNDRRSGPMYLGAYIDMHRCMDPRGEPDARRKAIDETLDRYKASGLRVIMPKATTTSGRANYDSEIIAERTYPDWNPFAYFINGARKRGLKVWPAVCVLVSGHDEPMGILAEHPEWAQRHTDGKPTGCISPGHPEARTWVVSVLEEIVREYQPDGILLDYLRYRNRPGQLNAASMAVFERGAPAGAAEDDDARARRLQKHREQCLTELAGMISAALRKAKPDLKIAIYSWGPHVVENHRVGQDWRTWVDRGYIDMINVSGYLYEARNGDDYLEQLEEKLKTARDIVAGTGRHIPVTFALGVRTSHGEVKSAAEIDGYLRAARRAGVDGVAFFTWSYLQPYLDDTMQAGSIAQFATGRTP